MGTFMPELYPTSIRGNAGRGFCYNAGRAIGSVFMTTIGFATAVMPLGTAIALDTVLEAEQRPVRTWRIVIDPALPRQGTAPVTPRPQGRGSTEPHNRPSGA